MHAIVVLFPASCWWMSVSSEFTHASDVQNSESRLFKSLHQVFVYQACFYIRAIIVQREKFFHLNKFNRSILLQRKKLLWLAIQWACETDQGFSRTLFQHRLMKSKRCGFACLTVRSNCGGNAVSQRVQQQKLHHFLLVAMLIFVILLCETETALEMVVKNTQRKQCTEKSIACTNQIYNSSLP